MDNNRNTESEERSNVSYLGDEELLNLFERYVEYIRVTLGVYSRVFQGMEIEDRIEFRVGKPAEQYGRYAISVSYRGQDLGMPVSGTGLRRTTTSHTMKNEPRYPANLFAGGIGSIYFFRHTGSEYTVLRSPCSYCLLSPRSNLRTIAYSPRTDCFLFLDDSLKTIERCCLSDF